MSERERDRATARQSVRITERSGVTGHVSTQHQNRGQIRTATTVGAFCERPRANAVRPYGKKDREHENSLSFFYTPCPARYSVLHLFGVLSGGNIAFLREEGGTRQGFPEANEMSFGGSLRSVTEGARVTLDLFYLHCNALSLSRLRRQLPPGGSLWMRATLGV